MLKWCFKESSIERQIALIIETSRGSQVVVGSEAIIVACGDMIVIIHERRQSFFDCSLCLARKTDIEIKQVALPSQLQYSHMLAASQQGRR